MSEINEQTCGYCFLDLNINQQREMLALAAAFVDATDSRYGFSSKDLRLLGGSELSRIHDLISTYHEWSGKIAVRGGVEVRPPSSGNRIVLKLYWNVAPLACENFATLCANGSLLPFSKEKRPKAVPMGECGKALTYRKSIIHRIKPGFVLQGGDFVFGNGSGGESIFNGKKFKDERSGLSLKHDRKGILSMGNSGKNSNSSQFFITFQATPQCDGKHVVFGEVVSGWEVLDAAEKIGTSEGEPTVPVEITDCGIFSPLHTPGAGYWYDKPDADAYGGMSPVFMVRPRAAVVAPSKAAVEKFVTAMGDYVVTIPLTVDGFDTNEAIILRISQLLDTFAIDVVVVAPACKDVMDYLTIPPSWKDACQQGELIPLEQVVLTSKPIDALATVRTQSWLSKQSSWRLDGTSD